MGRVIAVILIFSAALVQGGCDGGGAYYEYQGGWGYDYDFCGQFSSCGQCTPMAGCGWCSYGEGEGFCFSEPNQCRTEQFSWTWSYEGCAGGFDSGTTPGSAAADGGDGEASPASGEAAADGDSGAG